MAKTKVTKDAKPSGRSAFTSLELSQRLMTLEHAYPFLKDAVEAQLQRIVAIETAHRVIAQLRTEPWPGAGLQPQTPDTRTDEEREAARGDAVLRQRICTEVRDFFLQTFEHELVDRDLAFAASVWVEMLAVAIAGSVEMTLGPTGREAQVQDFLGLQARELGARVRRYVRLRADHPETGRIQ